MGTVRGGEDTLVVQMGGKDLAFERGVVSFFIGMVVGF